MATRVGTVITGDTEAAFNRAMSIARTMRPNVSPAELLDHMIRLAMADMVTAQGIFLETDTFDPDHAEAQAAMTPYKHQ